MRQSKYGSALEALEVHVALDASSHHEGSLSLHFTSREVNRRDWVYTLQIFDRELRPVHTANKVGDVGMGSDVRFARDLQGSAAFGSCHEQLQASPHMTVVATASD